MRSSTYIKVGAKEKAHNENAVLKRAVKFKEYDDLESEMDHFDSDMLDMYKVIHIDPIPPRQSAICHHKTNPIPVLRSPTTDLFSASPTSPTTDLFSASPNSPNTDLFSASSTIASSESSLTTIPVSPDNNNNRYITFESSVSSQSPIPDSSNNNNNLSTSTVSSVNHSPNTIIPTIRIPPTIIPRFPRNEVLKLPKPDKNNTQYSPLEAINIIDKLSDFKVRKIVDLQIDIQSGSYPKRRCSEYFLINLMIYLKLVPAGQSTMYSLLKEYRTNKKLKSMRWRTRHKTGSTPQLKRSSYISMVDDYNNTNVGGLSSSRQNLETSVNACVKKDILEEGVLKYKKRPTRCFNDTYL